MSYYSDEFRDWEPNRGIVQKNRKNHKGSKDAEKVSRSNKAWKLRKEKSKRDYDFDSE